MYASSDGDDYYEWLLSQRESKRGFNGQWIRATVVIGLCLCRGGVPGTFRFVRGPHCPPSKLEFPAESGCRKAGPCLKEEALFCHSKDATSEALLHVALKVQGCKATKLHDVSWFAFFFYGQGPLPFALVDLFFFFFFFLYTCQLCWVSLLKSEQSGAVS